MIKWIVLGQKKDCTPFIEWGVGSEESAKGLADFLNEDDSREKINGIKFKAVPIEIPDNIWDEEQE